MIGPTERRVREELALLCEYVHSNQQLDFTFVRLHAESILENVRELIALDAA